MAFAADAQAMQTAQAARWALRADPALCVLERHDAGSRATLSIRTIPGSDAYLVAIAAPGIKRQASYVPASLTFAPSQKVLNGRADVLKLETGMRAVRMDGVAPDLLGDLSGADTVTVAMRSGDSATVPVAGSAKAVEALRRCNADQLIEWGADARQFAPGGTTPVALRHRDAWFSKSELLKVKGQSRQLDVDAVFRVAVSPDGMVAECHSSSDKTEKGVEKTACGLVLGKPLFAPAKDAGGRAVRGVATFRILLASRPTL
jgi:hypothetical protein